VHAANILFREGQPVFPKGKPETFSYKFTSEPFNNVFTDRDKALKVGVYLFLKHNRPLWVAVLGLIRPTQYTYIHTYFYIYRSYLAYLFLFFNFDLFSRNVIALCLHNAALSVGDLSSCLRQLRWEPGRYSYNVQSVMDFCLQKLCSSY
jgi:hypothetical protein